MPKSTTTGEAGGPFVEVQTKLYIHLPPCFANKPIEGIHEQLNGFLMRYMPQVDGVVLAHSDLKLLQTSGRIMYDSPYCHFWISVKLLVWRPVKGSTLYGTINLQSPDHIGLLLYGTFNASIPSEFIPKDKYVFNPNKSYNGSDSTNGDPDSPLMATSLLSGEWVHKSTDESIGHEGVIEFEVSELVRTNDMLTVTGSLMKVPVMTRRPSMLPKHSPLLSGDSSSQKKRSAPEEDEHETKRIKKEKKKAAAAAAAAASTEEEPKKEKKDKKEKKEVAAAAATSAESGEEKKKKKKEKKDKKDKA
ncbi:hypothetical protein BG015_009185 [Linnemannia schmuckeri]|uniref:RPA43 OB domain-containing protein n=1 Tax=Linnemannia schmuckeri TaxID=64567 RepID=A0A9P5V9J3_9FUNG|nr:hypothetical protein BG015_009185 [Linnemannia schmuckeri]